jgi:cysteine desulfurase/selenocysteine lyase
LAVAVSSVRSCFPALVARPSVAFLDSASTAQKPEPVLAAARRYLSDPAASPGRGLYPWATRAGRELAEVREKVARFVNAEHPDEIVFTAGATAALNAVALAWGLSELDDGDEILYNPLDHASAVAPWRQVRSILARRGVRVRLVPYVVTDGGRNVRASINARTRLITTSHLHNVFGTVTTLASLDHPVLRCFDCSQSGGHLPVDVRALRADFAVLAGHKMFGLPGVGVLYAARRVHPLLQPFLPGGNTGPAMPHRLEGGTVNLAGVAALGAAVDFIGTVGLPAIAAHDRLLTERLVSRLRPLPGVTLLSDSRAGHGIVSFSVDGVSAADVGFAGAARDIYFRTGNHCLAGEGPELDAVRISTHVYTTTDEIDRCADLIAEVAPA